MGQGVGAVGDFEETRMTRMLLKGLVSCVFDGADVSHALSMVHGWWIERIASWCRSDQYCS